MRYETLQEIYANSIRNYAERPLFAMLDRESMTYAEFDARVEYVRGMLLGAGLSGGDKVAILSSNMPNWNVCYFAIVTSGMVAVPIMPDFSESEIERLLIHSEARALMISDRQYSRVPKHVLEGMNIVIRTKNLAVLNRTSNATGTPHTPHPDDTATIIYTSGTTSSPKGVMLSHRNLAMQVCMNNELFPVREDDVFMSVLPLSHTYECSIGMLLPFAQGASVVYVDRPPTASNLLPALARIRPTVMLVVPLIIEKIYKNRLLSKVETSHFKRFFYSKPFFRKTIHRIAGRKLYKAFGGHLRFFGIGGTRLDIETERFLLEGKFPYAIGYGLTETAPLIAGAIPGKTRLSSTGMLLNGIEARLENVNTEGDGELVVKSPCTMSGYYKSPELTAEVLSADGWFRTKDICRFDEDGYLYIKGRSGNMILGPNGENIYPEDIENVINSHFLVTDSLVTEDRGKLVALVKFNRGELEKRYHNLKDDLASTMETIKADIIKYVNSKVNKFSRIAKIHEQHQDFEKTPSQKIKRYLYTNKRKHSEQ